MLLHADSFPTTKDKRTIENIASIAEDRIKTKLDVEDGGKLTVCILEKLIRKIPLEPLEPSLSYPPNTPDTMIKFFESK